MPDYLLRNIPSDLWRQVKSVAALEGVTIRELILNALTERTNQEDRTMTRTIHITTYPAGLVGPERVSDEYLARAAEAFVHEVSKQIKSAYPDAGIVTDIKPVGDSGPDGGCSCEDERAQEECQLIMDRVFDRGEFWPDE
jgi:hypothetical protein